MLATAVLGVAVVLGGCGGEPNEPSPLDQGEDQSAEKETSSDDSTPTPIPSATDTGPKTVPSLKGEGVSKERQQEGEDFLRSYIDEINRANSTGDFAKLKTMVADSCELCKHALAGEEVYEQGNKIEGGKWTPQNIDYQGTVEGVMMFQVDLKIAESDDVDPNGNSIKHYDAGTSKHHYGITVRNSNWQVVGGDDISNEQ